MHKIVVAVSAAVLATALGSSTAASARASQTIVVGPGQSIQAAVDQASPGDTVLIEPGVYHESVLIQTDGITLRGSGDFPGGTEIVPPTVFPKTECLRMFGPTGICILAPDIDPKTGAVITPVTGDTVTAIRVTGFPANGVFGYGTQRMTVTRVAAADDGDYGISRFVSSGTTFADDTATGNDEAGFYVGDSPDADTVVRDNYAVGNQFGIFIRHARGVVVIGNHASENCQGIFVLDDGQPGGAGNATIVANSVSDNNKFCPKHGETPVDIQGGGILLLGATHTVVVHNTVADNSGKQINSGGIVVASARELTKGSDPESDVIVRNTAFGDDPADLIWDGTGTGMVFAANRCGTSIPAGLCH